MEPESDFYLTLSSKAPNVLMTNTCANFKAKLPTPLLLKQGIWKVALTQLSYPFNWNNLDKDMGHLTVIHDVTGGFKNYDTSYNGEERELLNLNYNEIYNKHRNDMSQYIRTSLPQINGYYPNIASIAEHIVKYIKHQYILKEDNKLLPISYNTNEEGSIVSFKGPIAFIFSNYPKWSKVINTENDKGEIANYRLFKLDKEFTANLDIINDIYVYSSIMEPNFVGDTMVPLLTVVPVEGKHGTQATYSPLRPEYKTLSQEYITDIEIQLNRSNGSLIPFQSGEVRVNLHFKRTSILS